jgi:hypothetical protein
MSTSILRQIRQAVEQLNPNEVREHAETDIWVRLNAASEQSYREMEAHFLPDTASLEKRRELCGPCTGGSMRGRMRRI